MVSLAVIPPHPNVAFIEPKDSESCPRAVFRVIRICRGFAADHVIQEKIPTIFLQLTHALHHIHENGYSHGQIAKSRICQSDSGDNVILTLDNISGAAQNITDARRAEDIGRLGRIFREILDDNSPQGNQLERDPLANNLLELMKLPETTSSVVLQHPYFWDSRKKLNFLSAVVQFSKSNWGLGLKEALNDSSKKVFEEESGWKSLLLLDSEEVIEAEKKLNSGRKGDMTSMKTVATSSVQQRSERIIHKKKPQYEDKKLQSLVNFMRNVREHFWTDSKEVQASFGFDPDDGYLRFFSKRFKNLFLIVYEVVKGHLEDHGSVRGISDVYFNVHEANKLFPEVVEPREWRKPCKQIF